MSDFSPEEKMRLVKLVLEEHRSINSISQEAVDCQVELTHFYV